MYACPCYSGMVPNPKLIIQEVQTRLEKDGDKDNNFVQFYKENYELE